MFDMTEFIKRNLIEGYWNGSFRETQVNMFAFNYLNRGQIDQEDFDYIIESIKPKEDDEPVELPEGEH